MNIKKYKNRILLKLGFQGFSKNLVNFAVIQTFFWLATTLSEVFIGIFLYKSGGQDFIIVAKFTFFKFLMELIAFILSLYVIKMKNVILSLRLGIAVYTSVYAILLVFQQKSRMVYWLIGMLTGIGSAFYWMAYHTLTKRYTTIQNRQSAFGFISIMANAVAIIVPPVSGFITGHMSGMRGYFVIFAISGITYLLAVIYSGKLDLDEDETLNYNVGRTLWKMIYDKGARSIVLAEICRGFRDGIVLYYLNILVYFASSSEFIVGICLACKSIVTVYAYNRVKHFKTAKQRANATIISGVFELVFLVVMLGTGLFNGVMNSMLIMIYSAGYMFYYVFALNQAQIAGYELMEWGRRRGSNDYEMVATRHFYLDLGRLVTLSVMIVLPADPIYGVCMLIFGGCTTMCSAFLFKRGSRLLQNEGERMKKSGEDTVNA